jgi:hypothetical protein
VANKKGLRGNFLSPSYSWGGRIRTFEWRIQSPLPYHLATPHRRKNRNTRNAK